MALSRNADERLRHCPAAESFRAGGSTVSPVTLSGLGIFPSSSAVFWAAPVVTPALLARHAVVQAALPDLQAHAHYHLGAWVPHVTLSGAVDNPSAALSVLLSVWQPLKGLLNRLELVRFRPVAVLQSYKLPLG